MGSLQKFWLGDGSVSRQMGAPPCWGKKGGLHTLVKSKYPNVLSWHCFSHRLELGVADALKSVNATNHFKSSIDELHKLYSMSPKNQAELEKVSGKLGEELVKRGRVFKVRWVACSYRAVHAVWKSYDAVAEHFLLASADQKHSSSEREKFKGLLKHLLPVDFVYGLCVMLDTLSELSTLSLDLQSNSISITEANTKMKHACRLLTSLKTKPDLLEQKMESKFYNHALKAHVKVITPIPKSQFTQAIVDSLNSIMFSAANSDSLCYNQLVSALTILNPSTWSPANLDDITFGDKSISFLCETFRLGDKTALVGKFRELVDSGGRRVDLVGAITSAVSVIAVSSAECERGFRAINGIITTYRASMKTETLSSLLFIQTACPPQESYAPVAQEHAKIWIRTGRNSAIESSSMAKQKHDWSKDEKKGSWDAMVKV